MSSMPISNRFTFEGNWYPDAIRQFPYVLYNRAEAAVRLNQEQSALKDLRAFIFVAGSNPNVGVVLYRIGDLLNQIGADQEQVLGAWRECIFRVPDTVGARLCSARKAAIEIMKAKKEQWPRLIASIEDARPRESEKDALGFAAEDLYSFVDLVLADAFIAAERPTQALFRMDPLYKREQSAYLKAWLDEYMMTAFAGSLAERLKEAKFKEVIAEYDRRRRVLLYKQTRPEILWNVVRAYEGLGLWTQAHELLNVAEEVKKKIDRKVARPYDPTPEEWIEVRARIGLRLLADHKYPPESVRASLEKMSAQLPATKKYWISYYQSIANPKEEAKWWASYEQSSPLSWTELKAYSQALEKSGATDQRENLMELKVGTWLGERDRSLAAKEPPPVEAMFELFEIRFRAKNYSKALSILDYLNSFEDSKLNSTVSKPMLAFRRGETLLALDRFADARQSFERAKAMAPESLWGKLASSAQKEMEAKKLEPASL